MFDEDDYEEEEEESKGDDDETFQEEVHRGQEGEGQDRGGRGRRKRPPQVLSFTSSSSKLRSQYGSCDDDDE